MKLFVSIAAASMVALGLSALPETAFAAPHPAGAYSVMGATQPTIRKVSGFDGYGFGLSGRGCGFGHGGGTGYEGCFLYERGYRGHRGYYGYGYARPHYHGRRRYYRGRYRYRGRRGHGW